jgi:DNA excision repair protein ERCC-4
MSVHYKNPILLIEFEEHKSFSLEVSVSLFETTIIHVIPSYLIPFQAVADVKHQSQKFKSASSKYSKQTAGTASGDPEDSPKASVQAKLVLLALTFPRLRIIWSSSPYASSEIFLSLKLNQSEPDPKKALLVGADETGDSEDPNSASKNAEGEGVNTAAEDLLRTFPGITAKNVRYVMRRVNSVRALCEMKMSEVQELLGSEPGKACYEFLHRKK